MQQQVIEKSHFFKLSMNIISEAVHSIYNHIIAIFSGKFEWCHIPAMHEGIAALEGFNVLYAAIISDFQVREGR